MGLLQNYRTAYLQVADFYTRQNEYSRVDSLLAIMDKQVPADVIPWSNDYLILLRESFSYVSNPAQLDSFVQNTFDARKLQIMAEHLYRLGQPEKSIPVFEKLVETDPNSGQALSYLISLYERTNQYEKGVEYLENWIEKNPNDKQAAVKLQQMKMKLKL
jgi:tetratricopeptide (TPR) repeat protein